MNTYADDYTAELADDTTETTELDGIETIDDLYCNFGMQASDEFNCSGYGY